MTEISKASGEQRSGRAGRTRPGHCYRLCTEGDFDALSLNTPPEMQRTDLSSAVLQLKSLGIDNVLRFEFPSSPPSKNLIACLELLFALGAIDDRGVLTTPLGEHMAELPIHPTLSKVLLSSGEFGCSQEIAAIVAMLQIEGAFVKPGGGQAAVKARVAKRKFEVAEGDLLTLLNVFNGFMTQGGDSKAKVWCSGHFIRYKAMRRARELFEQLQRTLKRFKVPFNSGDCDQIRRCIVSGFFPNAAYLHVSGEYRTVRGGFSVGGSPDVGSLHHQTAQVGRVHGVGAHESRPHEGLDRHRSSLAGNTRSALLRKDHEKIIQGYLLRLTQPLLLMTQFD